MHYPQLSLKTIPVQPAQPNPRARILLIGNLMNEPEGDIAQQRF